MLNNFWAGTCNLLNGHSFTTNYYICFLRQKVIKNTYSNTNNSKSIT